MDAEYYDDKTIPDDAILWRRIPRLHLKLNVATRTARINSSAFDDSPGSPMSVNIASESGSPEDFLNLAPDSKEFAVAAITAKLARDNNLGIIRNPLAENPGHALVLGKKTHSIRKKLAKHAFWIIEPSKELIERLFSETL